MQREGIDHENAEMGDILCDFCHKPWSMERAMVEGHRGACVCGDCLTVAYAELVLHKVGSPASPEEKCIMCREERDDPHWRSPMFDEALACRRCIKQAAGVLHKDRDIGWTKPTMSETPENEPRT